MNMKDLYISKTDGYSPVGKSEAVKLMNELGLNTCVVNDRMLQVHLRDSSERPSVLEGIKKFGYKECAAGVES